MGVKQVVLLLLAKGILCGDKTRIGGYVCCGSKGWGVERVWS